MRSLRINIAGRYAQLRFTLIGAQLACKLINRGAHLEEPHLQQPTFRQSSICTRPMPGTEAWPLPSHSCLSLKRIELS